MNKRADWSILILAIIILSSVGFWSYVSGPMYEMGASKTSKTVATTAKSDNATRPILARVQSRPVKSQFPPHRKLADGKLPGQVVAQVASSPDANTPDGDYATAVALRRCAYVSGTDAEIEERETRDSLRVDALRQSAGVPVPDKAAVDETIKVINGMKRERDSCVGIPKDVINSWRTRLEVLARAGDMEARQQLIRSISIDFPSKTEIDANPDEYAYRMALAEDYLLDRIATGDCGQATLTSLTDMGFGAKPSYVFYRIYAEHTLASMPRPDLSPEENDKMIASLKNRLAELQAKVPPDVMDDANQTVAYLQRTSCQQ